MIRLYIAAFLISCITLTAELMLTRVFDVILATNMSYMVITCAMFAFGLAGIYLTLRPVRQERIHTFLAVLSLGYGASTALLLPIMNILPFDHELIFHHPLQQIAAFTAMYAALAVPFLCAGLFLSALFTSFAARINTLYFWDLCGAALGAVVSIPLLPRIGPGGVLLCAAAVACLVGALLSPRSALTTAAGVAAVALFLLPILKLPHFYDFREHADKRGVKTARDGGAVEFSRWDPISKIDIVDQTERNPETGAANAIGSRKHIAYDGGHQSSNFYSFDGDLEGLRKNMPRVLPLHFWMRGVIASHYLKQDTHQSVLIIGSGGGQETKAALMYGASAVDAVEMVNTVVQLGRGPYASYIGHIFNRPRVVHVTAGEGRSFLRATDKKYDIIQMFSNHTSSSIASGTGALQTGYLMTVEAFQEYFAHLTPNGVLHINHHVYQRIITTAAQAWKESGRPDFQSHVIVYVRDCDDFEPTVLIKMSPWTREEVDRLDQLFFAPMEEYDVFRHLCVVDPLHPERSLLTPELFSGTLSESLRRAIPYRITPATDDRPYFSFLRNRLAYLTPDDRLFVDRGVAAMLNSQLKKSVIPLDVIHLIGTGIAGLVFGILFIFVPLYMSSAGRARWPGKAASLAYFGCIGVGFIVVELLFIQWVMKLVGSPLYTYATVLFTLLLCAGLGSASSPRLGINSRKHWYVPFIGVIATACLFLTMHDVLFNFFLKSPLLMRAAAAGMMMAPVGFFLGMPFPMGVSVVRERGAASVAWGWGLNAFCTVIGGVGSIVLSLLVGFHWTFVVAIIAYCSAFVLFFRMSRPNVGDVSASSSVAG